MKLTPRCLKRLEGVHPDLVKVVNKAAEITDLDFFVIEGLRTAQRQTDLVKAGASWTLNSRHLTGHAVDLGVLVNGEVRWDWPLYSRLGGIVKKAAALINIPIEWGGDWKKTPDGPHFQLPVTRYK